MPRLIDADELAEEIVGMRITITGLRAGNGVLTEFAHEYRKGVLRVVDEAPTIEAEPVKHGEWNVKYPLRECSCCGEIYSELGGNCGKGWNYCPNCGAKMDGGETE